MQIGTKVELNGIRDRKELCPILGKPLTVLGTTRGGLYRVHDGQCEWIMPKSQLREIK